LDSTFIATGSTRSRTAREETAALLLFVRSAAAMIHPTLARRSRS
jgi:hypothetical protein